MTTTPPTLALGAQLTGTDAEELHGWLTCAGWTPAQLAAAVDHHTSDPGWFEAVKRDAKERAADDAARSIGPRGFNLGRQQVLSIVKRPALKRLIEKYDGGR